MSSFAKSLKRPASNLTDSSDSDSDVKAVKKLKRPDYNELFAVKLSPFHKFHIALTNGKTDGDNILFVNIRNGFSVYGAGKGLVLGYDEIVHLVKNLNYTVPLPKFKNNNIKLIGKPKHGKFEFTRLRGDKKVSVALPITVMVGLNRILPAIQFLMESIKKYQDYEEGDQVFEEFLSMLQKITMVYIKDMSNNEANFTKADLRKMFWIYAGLTAIFNVPTLTNPFKHDNLKIIQRVEVDDMMIERAFEVIDHVILKTMV